MNALLGLVAVVFTRWGCMVSGVSFLFVWLLDYCIYRLAWALWVPASGTASLCRSVVSFPLVAFAIVTVGGGKSVPYACCVFSGCFPCVPLCAAYNRQ